MPERKMSAYASVFLFGALAVLGMILTWSLRGPEAVGDGVWNTGSLLVSVVPHVLLGLTIAGFLTVLLPREKISRLFGKESGVRGIVTASVIGAVIPGGPFASFPLVYAFHRAGVDVGALVAFITAWAAVSVNRLFIWEIPFMGIEFGVLRFLASIPIPIIAGLIARWLRQRYVFFETL